MSKKEKLLIKARNNPNGLKFDEFETLMKSCNWAFDHQTGSHRIWISPQGERLPVQPKESDSKGYQVKQFLRIYDNEEQL